MHPIVIRTHCRVSTRASKPSPTLPSQGGRSRCRRDTWQRVRVLRRDGYLCVRHCKVTYQDNNLHTNKIIQENTWKSYDKKSESKRGFQIIFLFHRKLLCNDRRFFEWNSRPMFLIITMRTRTTDILSASSNLSNSTFCVLCINILASHH